MAAELARVQGDEDCALRCPWVIGTVTGEANGQRWPTPEWEALSHCSLERANRCLEPGKAFPTDPSYTITGMDEGVRYKVTVSNRTSIGKRRTKSMTTVYFYEFPHKNMSALSAQRHVFGPFEANSGHLSMLCMGFGRAMAPRRSCLLRIGRSVVLTGFWGSPARPTLAAARTTADSPEIGP